MPTRFVPRAAAVLGGLLLALPALAADPAPAAPDPHAACKAAAAASDHSAHAGHGAAAASAPATGHEGHAGQVGHVDHSAHGAPPGAAGADHPAAGLFEPAEDHSAHAAHEDHSAHAAQAAAAAAQKGPPPAAASVTLEDLPLLDQDGASRRFRGEVVADRIVVMDFIFTTCTTICPLLSAKMARVQELLGDRLGRDVFLVSVSVDPTRDTPPKLLAYAKKWKARPGWTFLTGPKADVDAVLKGVGAYTANFYDHPPMFLVGDGKAGRWVRLNGFPEAEQILKQVDAMVAARGDRTAARGEGRP